MKHRDHYYFRGVLLVDHDIRETRYHRLPGGTVYGCVNLGLRSDAIEAVSDLSQEVRSQTTPLLFIPFNGGVELGFGLRQLADR
jgi:hypothetical protein